MDREERDRLLGLVARGALVLPEEAASLLDALDAAEARAEKAEGALSLVWTWTHEHGAALCPPRADTYGDGMRDAKQQVARILERGDHRKGGG